MIPSLSDIATKKESKIVRGARNEPFLCIPRAAHISDCSDKFNKNTSKKSQKKTLQASS